jgi:hypothetical protein
MCATCASGRCITDANGDELLSHFPRLKALRINGTAETFTNVPTVLQNMPELTDLTLYGAMPYAADMPARLAQLTRLEALSVSTSSYQSLAFDVSGMRNLRSLDIVAYSLFDWPALELPALERLNLGIQASAPCPPSCCRGTKTLVGLSLDWSRFSGKTPLYEYVKTLPEHLIDRETMVRDYCRGELRRLGEGVHQSTEGIFHRFFEQWPDEQQRFTAINALSDQYAALERELSQWQQRSVVSAESLSELIARSNLVHVLKASWRNGLFKRYGATISASTVDLSGLRLSELPVLPADAFAHVRTLLLNGQRVAGAQMRGFISAFSEVRTLDLSNNALHEWPIESQRLSRLMHLDLADNLLTDGSSLQSGLSELPALEQLNLRNNPLSELNVGSLQRLKALDLQRTHLQHWPAGAEACRNCRGWTCAIPVSARCRPSCLRAHCSTPT